MRITKAMAVQWENLSHTQDMRSLFLGIRHPVLDICKIICVGGPLQDLLLKKAVRLWDEFQDENSQSLLMQAFGDMSPLSNSQLQELYHSNFELNGRHALSILLDRNEIGAASVLFRARVAEFGDVDPVAMDWLVKRGLPVDDAKIWLDQSCNTADNPLSKAHYTGAIERWTTITPLTTTST